MLWAERWAADYQMTPHSTVQRHALSGRERQFSLCSQHSEGSAVQKQSIKCSSWKSSTYNIISRGCSAAGRQHAHAGDGIHGQLGQGIREVSHLRHHGLLLEERGRIKGLPAGHHTPAEAREPRAHMHATVPVLTHHRRPR